MIIMKTVAVVVPFLIIIISISIVTITLILTSLTGHSFTHIVPLG